MNKNENLDVVDETNDSLNQVQIEVSTKQDPLLKALNLEINLSKFKSSDDVSNSKEQGPKYNLKIKKRDLVLIDEIANLEGISRAELVNKLIHNYFLSELNSIEESNNEYSNNQLRILIASRADAIAQKMCQPNYQNDFVADPLGWSGEIVKDYVCASLNNYFNYGDFAVDHCPNLEGLDEDDYIEQSRTDAYKKIREKLLEK